MKFYIASRVKNKKLVGRIHKIILKKGHKFSSSWIEEKDIIPYEKNTKAASKRSQQCIKDSSSCDVFILISDISGAGMYTELGAALLHSTSSKKPKIYVIGEYINRSMFFFHPSIKRLETIEEVFEDLDSIKRVGKN
jgi:hypothetical protein